MQLSLEDVFMLIILLLGAASFLLHRWTRLISKERKCGEKKDQEQTPQFTDDELSLEGAVPITLQSFEQFNNCCTVGQRLASDKGQIFKPIVDCSISPEISDKCFTFSGSDTLGLSQVSDVYSSTLSDDPRRLSKRDLNESLKHNYKTSKQISCSPETNENAGLGRNTSNQIDGFGHKLTNQSDTFSHILSNLSGNLNHTVSFKNANPKQKPTKQTFSRDSKAYNLVSNHSPQFKNKNPGHISQLSKVRSNAQPSPQDDSLTSQQSNTDTLHHCHNLLPSSNDVSETLRSSVKDSSRSHNRTDLIFSENDKDSGNIYGSCVDHGRDISMDARLRRRLLQKTSDVTSGEPANWRSRVYQGYNTNSSNSSGNYGDTYDSLKRKQSLGSLESSKNNEESAQKPRRRRSEDSQNSALAERLARRRAQRLEERQGSSSQDGSCEGSFERDIQLSKDGSFRSFESDFSEHAKQDDGSACNDEIWRDTGEISRRSAASTESFGNSENVGEISSKSWRRQIGSGSSNGSDQYVTSDEFRNRKWSSKDSNFISVGSSCSFRSQEDECCNVKSPAGVGSLDVGSADSGGERMKRFFHNESEDSAYSRSKEDANCNNNNNNNDIIFKPSTISTFSTSLQEHQMEIDEPDNISKLSPQILMSTSYEKASRWNKSVLNGTNYGEARLQNTNYPQQDISFVADTISKNGTYDNSKGQTNISGINDKTEMYHDAGSGDNTCNIKQADACETWMSKDLHIHEDLSEDLCLNKPAHESTDITFDALSTRQLEPSIIDEDMTVDKAKHTNATKKRKLRKDKSALRKSSLNRANEVPTEDVDQEDNSSLASEPGHAQDKSRKSLTATRQKFMQNAAADSETSSTSTSRLKSNGTADLTSKPIVRGRTDFNQLLQKFSGSESNSEKSDNDASSSSFSGVPRRRSLVRRQEAKDVISSSEESDSRRTPDRTQSLKLPSRLGGVSENKDVASFNQTAALTAVEKSSSFRSEFMNKRWAQKSTEFSQVFNHSSPTQTTATTVDTTTNVIPTKVPLDLNVKTERKKLKSQESSIHNKVEPNSSLEQKITTRADTNSTPIPNSSKTYHSSLNNNQPQTAYSSQIQPQVSKPISSQINSERNSFRKTESSNSSAVKPNTDNASKIQTSANTIKHVDADITTKTSVVQDKSMDLIQKVARERSTEKSIEISEKSVNNISVEKTTNRAASLYDENSIDKGTSPVKKSMNKSTTIDQKSTTEATSLSERSNYRTKINNADDTSLNINKRSEVKDINVGENYVDKSTSSTERSIGKSETINKDVLDKDASHKENSDHKNTNRKEKSVEKTATLNEKSVNIDASLRESRSWDRTSSISKASVDKESSPSGNAVIATTFTNKYDDKATSGYEKPIEANLKLDTEFVNKTEENEKPATQHNESITSVKTVIYNESSVSNSLTKFSDSEVNDGNKRETLTCREHPQARPRTTLRRDSKSEVDLPATTSTFSNSMLTSSSCAPSTLSSSVSSSEIKALAASSETISSNLGGEVRRAFSFKEVNVARTDSMEARKGILKRNTSLTKHDGVAASSFPIIDPQLARILRQRKQIVGDASDKEDAEEKEKRKIDASELGRRAKVMTPAEEIEETLRYSKEIAVQKGLNPEEDEGLKVLSVADRITSMQTRIEEDKVAVVNPKSRSAISTPSSRQRSGVITPIITQKSYDETMHQSLSMSTSVTEAAVSTTSSTTISTRQPQEQKPTTENTSVSSNQLIEKLTNIVKKTDDSEKKRHRFQRRSRTDWRYQTQPVTYDEIQAADSLETVSAFRALVRKQASFNAFDQVKDQTSIPTKQQFPAGGKKTEFPQHLVPPAKLPRRGRKLRHRTLPVTAEELNAVPENQLLVTDPDWVKFDEFDKRDSKTDSGILSGSDADSLHRSDSWRTLSLDMDLTEYDPSRLSVTDRASMFKILEEKTKAEKDKEKSASGAKRYINRKKRERSQTMPITDEEVKSASEIGAESGSALSDTNKTVKVNNPQPEVVNRSRSSSITEDCVKDVVDDELVKLSLIEKVKLFSQQKVEEKPPAKIEAPVIRRRNRKIASRFNTQPVTIEEVEKAAEFTRISPLAMSMVKPPDPEILKGLPLKDQRELMAQHAEMFLSQTSLRSRSGSNASQSQPSSRRTSVNLDQSEATTKDGDEELDKEDKSLKPGILKDKCASAKDLHEVKSILKTDPIKARSESEVHSILKMDIKNVLDKSFTSSEPRGILKKTKSEDFGNMECNDDIKSILKHTDNDEEENHNRPRSRSNSQPLGILKIENLNQFSDHSVEVKSILKAPSQENVCGLQVIKSAMRRGSLENDFNTATGGALKSVLRARNKNSLENEDINIEELISSDGNTSRESNSNSNNSQKHVGQIESTPTEKVDISSKVTNSKQITAISTSNTFIESVQASTTVLSVESAAVNNGKDNLQLPDCSEDKSGQSCSDGESSSGEILDGTPRASRLKRKSRFTDKAVKTDRYKTQPPEVTETAAASALSGETTPRQKYKYESRHKTQPITPNEMREAEAITPVADLTRTPGGSIADR